MAREDVKDVLTWLLARDQKTQLSKSQMESYLEELADLDGRLLDLAAKSYAASKPWFPKPSDLRTRAVELFLAGVEPYYQSWSSLLDFRDEMLLRHPRDRREPSVDDGFSPLTIRSVDMLPGSWPRIMTTDDKDLNAFVSREYKAVYESEMQRVKDFLIQPPQVKALMSQHSNLLNSPRRSFGHFVQQLNVLDSGDVSDE